MVQALVPLKDLVEAKSRLAGLLRPSERRALAQAMAEDVLTTLTAHPGVSGVTLVSDDPGANLLADSYGADYWPEQSLGCRGLNALVRCASERLLAASAGQPLLVLHADLPLLAAADIDAALDLQCAGAGLVIGCDRQGIGTNLLAFDQGCVPDFRFGADSCARHRASAREAGFPVDVLHSPGIALDIDEAGDLGCLMAELPAQARLKTAQLLYNTPLGGRVQAALGTLPGSVVSADAANRGKRG